MKIIIQNFWGEGLDDSGGLPMIHRESQILYPASVKDFVYRSTYALLKCCLRNVFFCTTKEHA